MAAADGVLEQLDPDDRSGHVQLIDRFGQPCLFGEGHPGIGMNGRRQAQASQQRFRGWDRRKQPQLFEQALKGTVDQVPPSHRRVDGAIGRAALSVLVEDVRVMALGTWLLSGPGHREPRRPLTSGDHMRAEQKARPGRRSQSTSSCLRAWLSVTRPGLNTYPYRFGGQAVEGPRLRRRGLLRAPRRQQATARAAPTAHATPKRERGPWQTPLAGV